MTHPFKVTDLRDPCNAREAIFYIVNGVIWFLGTWKRALATLGIVGIIVTGGTYKVFERLSERTVQIIEAKPIKPDTSHSLRLEFMPLAFARSDPQGRPIILDGELWGYADTTYEVFKLDDKKDGRDRLLVWDKVAHQGYEALTDLPKRNEYKQMFKK